MDEEKGLNVTKKEAAPYEGEYMITTAEEARKLATEQRAEVSSSYQACIEDINWAARHVEKEVIGKWK